MNEGSKEFGRVWGRLTPKEKLAANAHLPVVKFDFTPESDIPAGTPLEIAVWKARPGANRDYDGKVSVNEFKLRRLREEAIAAGQDSPPPDSPAEDFEDSVPF